jgi:drug/metabolite transporter (DMT)-like permease
VEATSRDNLKLAVGAILLTCFALSLGDALIKQQSASFVIWQIFVMRSIIALPFLVYLVRIRNCNLSIQPRHLGWTLTRSLILVLMWIFYFAALPHIALAVAAAAYYTLPIFISLMAAIFLREKITISGWLAIVIGFLGTLLILQPQADDFDAYALLPLVSALCYACAMTLTRGKCQHEKPTVLSLWLNISFVIVGAVALLGLYLWSPDAETVALNPFLLGAWTPMLLDEWRIMGILAIAILIGSVGAAYAYQNGPASTIASFDFSYVGFATIWGFILFDEIPGSLVSLGIILIVIAGAIAARGKSG